ncbi:MAG: AAA family ATPase [Treponema sp.]|jgi:flagellar biosynthesis protein FlhF|nr:AAA family ATPase [Treponema sp.]
MECFVEQGISYNDCLGKIIAKYGDRIQIVTQRDIRLGGFLGFFPRNGVEIEFYIPQHFSKSFAGAGLGRAAGFGPFSAPVPDAEAPKNPETSKKPLDFAEAKKQVLAAAGKDSTQMMILNEVRTIKEKLDAHDASARPEDHPVLTQIAEMLALNDFSAAYITAILERGRKELTLETLDNFNEVQNKVLEWIGETIQVFQESKYHKLPRIMVLVGPTGVGKTTTVAKLAAAFGLGSGGEKVRSVRLITIDAFRIGARAQIETYGELMDFPVAYVDNYNDLKKEIALAAEGVDLVLIDTIGKSPRDSAELGKMKELLNACGYHAEVYLVIAATVKSSDIHEILRQFEPFNYRSLILTKLDETTRVGNVICALAEKGKSLAYITNGQKVPSDLHRATVLRFLLSMEGFQVNRELMEKRFPAEEADQI